MHNLACAIWCLTVVSPTNVRFFWDADTGLVAATDPFGGTFDVLPPIWAAAHTTQFTNPGWKLAPVGKGSGWMKGGGTYVTYVGSDPGDITIVVEKMDFNQSICQRGHRPLDQVLVTSEENVTFTLINSMMSSLDKNSSRSSPLAFRDSSLVVWASHFGGSESDQSLFVRLPDVPVIDGKYVTIQVLPNFAYTISSVRTATKGGKMSDDQHKKKPGSFPPVYFDDFEGCSLPGMPQYVAPMAGAFECVEASGGRSGKSVRQMSPAKAICDRGDVMPYAILGNGFRTEYNVSIDVLLPSISGLCQDNGMGAGAFVGARVKGPVGSGTGMGGIFFAINKTSWYMALRVSDLDINATESDMHIGHILASGPLSQAGSCTSRWRRISLFVWADRASAAIDGMEVASNVKVPLPHDHFTGPVAGETINLGSGGYAAFGTVGYMLVEFDNIQVDSSFR